MRKMFTQTLLLAVLAGFTLGSTSCATILGGKVSEQQRTKPVAGQPARKIRVVALIGDALFGVLPIVVDFATGAIYKPENK